MDIQTLIANSGTSQLLLVSFNDLKEICSYLYNEERLRQEKLKEQENDGLLDSKQVMKLLKVKIGTLWRWNKSGYLPCRKIGCRNYWSREVVEEIRGKRGDHEDD